MPLAGAYESCRRPIQWPLISTELRTTLVSTRNRCRIPVFLRNGRRARVGMEVTRHMGMNIAMTTRCSISVRWKHVRVVIIVVVLVILSVLTHGNGDTTLFDALLPRV